MWVKNQSPDVRVIMLAQSSAVQNEIRAMRAWKQNDIVVDLQLFREKQLILEQECPGLSQLLRAITTSQSGYRLCQATQPFHSDALFDHAAGFYHAQGVVLLGYYFQEDE